MTVFISDPRLGDGSLKCAKAFPRRQLSGERADHRVALRAAGRAD
jgi:hypothetical protein